MFLVVYYLPDEVTIRIAAVKGDNVTELMDNLCGRDPAVSSVDQIVSLRPLSDPSTLERNDVSIWMNSDELFVRLGERKVGHLSVIVESKGTVYEGHNAKDAMDMYIYWGMEAREGRVKSKRVTLLENGKVMQYWEARTHH